MKRFRNSKFKIQNSESDLLWRAPKATSTTVPPSASTFKGLAGSRSDNFCSFSKSKSLRYLINFIRMGWERQGGEEDVEIKKLRNSECRIQHANLHKVT
ncbi:MAG TPA: hypothetical protein PKU78_04235 [Candidatus Dojkabacteria bacterium]|nr:hypothetical protein [Candidatus Dojkabacteria bacterium]HRP51305.1 hypothetical protein [Candidatus Dojkabacteria bacterium]